MRALIVAVALAFAPSAPCARSAPSAPVPITPPSHFHELAHTYSIVAVDPTNGDLGVAVQSAALLVVRKNGGYLGGNDRFIDIRVYDAPDPIKELKRRLGLHKLHFFPSEPADLLPITPDILSKLEPILLREPVNQAEKWLKAPQGQVNQTFLVALRDFMYWENCDVRVRMDGKIDRVVLEDILKKRR
jgi:uncharacterized Ntn-hydrolase superfamily protein